MEIRKILKDYNIEEKILTGLESDSLNEQKEAFCSLTNYFLKINYKKKFEQKHPYQKEFSNLECRIWGSERNYNEQINRYNDMKKLYQIRILLFYEVYPYDIKNLLQLGTQALIFKEYTHPSVKSISDKCLLKLERIVLKDLKTFLEKNNFHKNLEYIEDNLNSDSKLVDFVKVLK